MYWGGRAMVQMHLFVASIKAHCRAAAPEVFFLRKGATMRNIPFSNTQEPGHAPLAIHKATG
ncbi:hypothetical protein EMIT0P12_40447 [Pseudomonas sp. IT-P12]